MDLGSKDLINSLPDALLCHILSFLSTKDAPLTSLLSKRWRFLLAFVPNLDLDSSVFKHRKVAKRRRQWIHKSFKVFVNRLMALQGNAPVLDLDLHISSESDYHLPSKVFMNKTLVRLKLGSKDEFIIDVQEVFLPKLKTLYLHGFVCFEESGVACAKLISGCPVLEELVMINLMWGLLDVCSVSNPTLKRVTICCETIDYNPQSVSFDTPNLVYLEFTDVVAIKYPKVNLDSLVEARLGLRLTPYQITRARNSVDGVGEEMVGNASDFLMGISNVKILYLSSHTLEVLNFCCKEVPLFKNLTHITIETDEDVGWESLPNLLENCPNLETIIFKGLHYRDTNQCWDERYRFKDTMKCFEDADRCVCKPWEGTPICLSSSPVKNIEVLKFGEVYSYKDDMDRQTEVIKYFLETMQNLEQVILYFDTPFDDDLSVLSTELQMLEKVASPKCKIQVISDNISFSSTVHSSSSASGLVFFNNTFPV
ncbi:Leucine-rich repeat 2 [Arabidopsis suecica]|uniref:Leucine-rich repeat 2 n=1 Tax=Arabidopsis suecica TaxID=45249 RepID=A0A8T1ZZR9_ARASU|nr:Leucine-rich repeat 2 [Arabidopsis suecica]